MSQKYFSRDGEVTTSIEYDEAEDRMIVGHHQDVAPVLDHIAARNNDGTGGWSPSRDFRLLGSIPEALYNEWLIEAHRKNIPIYHKKVRDEFLKKKFAEHRKLLVNGRSSGRIGYQR